MVIVACSVFEDELRAAMAELNMTHEVLYIPSTLDLDYDELKSALESTLAQAASRGEPIALLYGTACHPEMTAIAERHGAKLLQNKNCIAMLLGEKLDELGEESNTYFLTRGWLKKWQELIRTGVAWSDTDARLNFGVFDRTVALDSGTGDMSDEDLFDFFEYTQVPIEPYEISLERFKQQLSELTGE
ncbi:MAG: DUF1638 domain-containing protein [Oscillospiraceae bacterium]|jgi:hypothetical protein|nr:DUF1638 domain-containing protein [Oscillospiraceae bacterium]